MPKGTTTKLEFKAETPDFLKVLKSNEPINECKLPVEIDDTIKESIKIPSLDPVIEYPGALGGVKKSLIHSKFGSRLGKKKSRKS